MFNDGVPQCPRLAKLGATGVNYLDTSTSKPSDSFPGLMARMTGGSPGTAGGTFYDVADDRSLDPPATTTTESQDRPVSAGPAPHLVPPPNSARASTSISSTAARAVDGGRASIDPNRAIPRTAARRSSPGTSFAATRSSVSCTRPAATRPWSNEHPFPELLTFVVATTDHSRFNSRFNDRHRDRAAHALALRSPRT